jgi:hypothetical protein
MTGYFHGLGEVAVSPSGSPADTAKTQTTNSTGCPERLLSADRDRSSGEASRPSFLSLSEEDNSYYSWRRNLSLELHLSAVSWEETT